MNADRLEKGSRPAEFYFLLLSLLADLLAVLGWLGLQPDPLSRFLVVTLLGLAGAALSATSLYSTLRLMMSVRGAYYPSGVLRRRALIAALSLVVSGVILLVGVQLAPKVGTPANSVSPAASPSASR